MYSLRRYYSAHVSSVYVVFLSAFIKNIFYNNKNKSRENFGGDISVQPE